MAGLDSSSPANRHPDKGPNHYLQRFAVGREEGSISSQPADPRTGASWRRLGAARPPFARRLFPSRPGSGSTNLTPAFHVASKARSYNFATNRPPTQAINKLECFLSPDKPNGVKYPLSNGVVRTRARYTGPGLRFERRSRGESDLLAPVIPGIGESWRRPGAARPPFVRRPLIVRASLARDQ